MVTNFWFSVRKIRGNRIMQNKTVVFVSNDIELHTKLSGTGYFTNVKIESDLSNVGNPDILIVSDRIVFYNEFLELYDKRLSGIKHVFYMLTDNSAGGRIITFLKAKGVYCIPPKLTKQQIIEKICTEAGIDISGQKNIGLFLGADSKVGTTITTQAIAETIARNSKQTIGLLFLNGDYSTDYVTDNKGSAVLGLDLIKQKVMSKILSANELKDACISNDTLNNLFILPGVFSIRDIRFYHQDHIEYLIQVASQLFDAVIIDAGSIAYSGMAIGALNTTKNRYLITTQQETARSNYETTCKQVFSEIDIDPNDFFLIANKHVNHPELYTAAQLANTYNANLLSTITMVDNGLQAEKDHKTLINYDNQEYILQIGELSRLISRQLGVSYEIPVEKKGLLKRLFH
jgi:hypothetical protein